MIIGAHVSIAGGVWNAPANAAEQDLETFQIFTRSPRGGEAPKLGREEVKKFEKSMQEHGFEDFAIHAPYYTNLGSSNNRIFYGTISVLREELERGSLLGASYVMFHPGSLKDLGQEKGMEQVSKGVGKVLDGYKDSTKLLVEISAGAGEICGDQFDELAQILKHNQKYLGKTLGGICFDTQHAFASGYDLRTKESVEGVFKEFDKEIGLEYLKLMHTNDSRVELGACKDRHENIGRGYIGVEGFKAVSEFLKSKKLNLGWILETKGNRTDDVGQLKEIREKVWQS